MEKGTSQFCRSAGRCGAMRRGVHAGMPLGCPLLAQGMQPPMGMLPRPGHAAAKAKAGPHGHAAAKAWACMQQPRPRHAAKAVACLRGHAGMPLGAGSRAPRGTLACPWHARCLRGSGRTARPWHAPWVGCQGRGMPLGPLQGPGSTWGGCCCHA